MERNHIFPKRSKHEVVCSNHSSCVCHTLCQSWSHDHFQIWLLWVNFGTCKIFTRSPGISLAANPMESTAEKTNRVLRVLHNQKVWQWFEHGSSFQMVARLSLVSSAGSWGKKSGSFFCCFQTCENDELHLRLVEVS